MRGKLIATSIIQGGPGFPMMMPAAYHYISCGDYQSPELSKVYDLPLSTHNSHTQTQEDNVLFVIAQLRAAAKFL